MLVFKFRCYAEYKSSNVKTFKYAKGDYGKLRALVSECDMSVVEDMPMEEGWRYLEDNITTAMNKSIPKSNRNEGPHNRSNRPMWMNNTALVKVKSKNEAYKFMVEFMRLFIKCCPLRENCMKQNEIPKKPWLSRGLVNACHKKNYLYRQFLKHRLLLKTGIKHIKTNLLLFCGKKKEILLFVITRKQK